jgi:predicted porin
MSLNYNRGPWTAGAFVQWSTHEGDAGRARDDRLRALEAGLSYRVSTKLRFYGAWYHFDFDDEGGHLAADRHSGSVALIGLRATL